MAVVCPCPVPQRKKMPFQLSIKAGIAGGPMIGANTYINLALVDALDVNEIYVNNTPETVQEEQVAFDPATGKISRFQSDGVTPNRWQLNDVLVVNYSKLFIVGTGGEVLRVGAPEKISLSGDGTYILQSGLMIYKVAIKPTAADTVRIGTTLGGDEIMFDKVMTPNVFGDNGFNSDVYADSGNLTIYFTGFTSAAQINIYKLPI